MGNDLFGLTFPEEQDRNRWYDTKEPYMESNMYKVARYSYENNLGACSSMP